jgi:drug/metabolite transporter (DMT)-like permease
MRSMSPTFLALISIALWSALAALSVELKAVPPFLLVGLALLIGGLVGVPKWREWKCSVAQLALGVYGLFAYHLLLFIALRNAPTLEANLINYLWPLLIVLLSPLFVRGMRLTALHLSAALLGFLGAVLLITGGKFSFEKQYLVGYVCAVSAAFVWATYSLASRRFKASSAVVSLYCLASGVLSLVAHAVLEPSYSFSMNQWPWLIALGLGPMGLAFFTWDAAMKRSDARMIGSLSYFTPLLSTLLLVLFGFGRFTLTSALAMVMIVAGAILGSVASR